MLHLGAWFSITFIIIIIDQMCLYIFSRRMKNFATYAKQAVVLSGFGAILFEEAVRKIAFIHSMFEEQIHGHKINDWEVERFQDNLAISAHSRYFAQKRHVKANDRHSFQPFVDQNGELEKLKGENFVHSSDNVVKYVMRSKKEDGSFQLSYFILNMIIRFMMIDSRPVIQHPFK